MERTNTNQNGNTETIHAESASTESDKSTNNKIRKCTTKKSTTLYEYLHETGVLESGDENLISKVKAAYWRSYQKQYKREKRSRGMECVIVFDEDERKAFTKHAKKYKVSIPSLIKKSALAYIEKYYIYPSEHLLQSIEQKLSRIYSGIERLIETRIHNPEALKESLQSIERIEQRLEDITKHPIDLETELKHAIEDNPNYQKTLQTILNHYDHQIKSEKID
ncbi:MAG: hypothetical protein JNL95_03765 [Chitinophagales bacterium]|nr:hypothetical protein [Chitinophagales bacterium]